MRNKSNLSCSACVLVAIVAVGGALWRSRLERLDAMEQDFGPDGRLAHKYSSTVYEPGRPAAMGWLASGPRNIFRSFGF